MTGTAHLYMKSQCALLHFAQGLKGYYHFGANNMGKKLTPGKPERT